MDRLTDLVTNLLDLSRLPAGVLSVAIRPVDVDEALEDTPGGGLTAAVGLPIALRRLAFPDEVGDLTSAD